MAQETGWTGNAVEGKAAPVDPYAQGGKFPGRGLADDAGVKIPAIQDLGLFQWLGLIGCRQGVCHQLRKLCLGYGEVRRGGACAQVAGLSGPLPQLLPLATAGVVGQFGAECQEQRLRLIFGGQGLNLEGGAQEQQAAQQCSHQHGELPFVWASARDTRVATGRRQQKREIVR
ncbi:hypothetical protein EMIT053CA3_40059 [Pseudomonas donghuensis]